MEGESKSWFWRTNNNQLLSQGYNKDGKQDGEYKEYYEDGKIKQETYYIKGLKEGSEKVFMNNGDRVSESEFKDDKLNGKHKRYFKNILILECHYKEGKLDGEYTSYWDNGKVCTKTTYKNDKLDGEWEYWNEDGTLKEKLLYKDGEKQV